MRRVLRYSIVCSVLLGGTIAIVPTVSATQPSAPVTSADSGLLAGVIDSLSGVVASPADALSDTVETLTYWTPERMRAAQPASEGWLERHEESVQLLPEFSPDRAEPRSQAVSAAGVARSWSGGGAVTKTTGKVFFNLGGADYVCSASSVRSHNKDTVLTAGHCVNAGPGEFATQWIFVPGYRDGQRPFGTWTARQLFAPPGWTERGDIDQDVGFAVLNKHNGAHLADVVGYQLISFNAGRGKDTWSFGYPSVGKYDGHNLFYCRDKARRDRYGSRDQGVKCDMTDGSSGGPWLSSFNPVTGTGILTSVNSFGYDGVPDMMWGPYLDEAIRRVYMRAVRA